MADVMFSSFLFFGCGLLVVVCQFAHQLSRPSAFSLRSLFYLLAHYTFLLNSIIDLSVDSEWVVYCYLVTVPLLIYCSGQILWLSLTSIPSSMRLLVSRLMVFIFPLTFVAGIYKDLDAIVIASACLSVGFLVYTLLALLSRNRFNAFNHLLFHMTGFSGAFSLFALSLLTDLELISFLFVWFVCTAVVLLFYQLNYAQHMTDHVDALESDLQKARKLLLHSDSLNVMSRMVSGIFHELGSPIMMSEFIAMRLKDNKVDREKLFNKAQKINEKLLALRTRLKYKSGELSMVIAERLPLSRALELSALALDHERSQVTIEMDLAEDPIFDVPSNLLVQSFTNIWSFVLHHAISKSSKHSVVISFKLHEGLGWVLNFSFANEASRQCDIPTSSYSDHNALVTGLHVSKELLASYQVDTLIDSSSIRLIFPLH